MNEKKAKYIRKVCMRMAKPKEPMRKYAWQGGKPNSKGDTGTIVLAPDCTRARIKKAKRLTALMPVYLQPGLTERCV
ncbi:MAG: hypothetical protein HQM06_13345 [Magnetococcales bacterium]|nr:hypothetical protein [Magnetococcales bacterium]